MMMKTKLLAVSVLALGVPAFAQASLGLGEKAPLASTKMKNVDGKETSVAELAGAKGTLVVFTCNHCPYAKAWEDRIVELGNTFSKQGVGVVAVNPNDPGVKADDSLEAMQARAKEKGFQFPYVVDSTSDVAKAYGATKTPEVFLFDASGKLVYKGAVDDNSEDPKAVKQTYLKDALTSVVAGKKIALAETKALGCGIKFRGK
jgi:peroxiredoxin